MRENVLFACKRRFCFVFSFQKTLILAFIPQKSGTGTLSSLVSRGALLFGSLSSSLKSKISVGENQNVTPLPTFHNLLFGDEKSKDGRDSLESSGGIPAEQQTQQMAPISPTEKKKDVEYVIDLSLKLLKIEPKDGNLVNPLLESNENDTQEQLRGKGIENDSQELETLQQQENQNTKSQESDMFSVWTPTPFSCWSTCGHKILQCSLIDPKGSEHKRFVVFHPETLILLQPSSTVETETNEVQVTICCKHSYSAIRSIVLHKSNPKLVVLRYYDKSGIIAEESLLIEGVRDFIKLLRRQVEDYASKN
jgi:hypothetical protein